MEEEFDERISEFSQITGSVIKGFSEKRESLQSFCVLPSAR